MFGLVAKILLLGLVAALAVWAAFPLIEAHAWVGLAVEAAVSALVFYAYLTPRRLPLKYLLPGTLFLVAFQVVPVFLTMSTAFSNFGDGHRGTKQDAITAIQTASVVEVPGSPEYALKVVTKGDNAIAFLLTDPAGKQFLGDAQGLKPVAGVPDGYTPLNLGEAGARSQEITKLAVPTAGGAIRSSGISRAYEGRAQRTYQAGCDCVVEAGTGHRWTAHDGSFVDAAGQRLPQGWRINVGLRNFTQVATDSRIARPFFRTLAWNLVFAVASVLTTFALGMLCALALHTDRLRGRTLYRMLLVLPYAMPSFAMLLVWRDMFNADFGLINRLFGLSVDWLGTPWSARLAVILVQLWLGYPYMFLVTTGALQAIPRQMTEAAQIDGATPWQAFRRVTLPLLLVALAPLLISSFAFNFNNFNAIYLTTEGGPFPADDPTAGATDLLITYTYRLAFGAAGARYGFAAAVSIYIFAIVALISAISFRRTRRQEEVYA
ncbi:ABC transporter permease subunit [Planosporangium thailandense]|uniref:ABC transporter permease subunit n=1 Tax=Planosporangium thailandense TaxID=765197 RepID=UPI00197BA29F|nr:ABC transporter permease subunit [Planosporangium thailandense]